MNEEDKRVIRTRSSLSNALIELSCEEGYDAVTIQDITDRAEINYRTFYRHYESKDALLLDVLRTTMSDLRKLMPPPTPAELNDANFEEIATQKGSKLYTYVAEKSSIFRMLLQSGPAALVPIQAIAQAETEMYMADLPPGKVPYELIANHIITSTVSFIQWWLDNDMSYTPQQMGSYAAQLIMYPIHRLLLESSQDSPKT